jgi:hypothetical protein
MQIGQKCLYRLYSIARRLSLFASVRHNAGFPRLFIPYPSSRRNRKQVVHWDSAAKTAKTGELPELFPKT